MRSITPLKRQFVIIALAFAASTMSSCNLLVPLVVILAPDPEVKAVFELPDRPTVVFVDDRKNLVTPTTLRRVIANRVSRDLMLKKVLTTTIESVDAMVIARQNDTDEYVMPMDAIGRAVGAELIIYVEMLDFRERPDPYTPKPRGVCSVRVIDVVNHIRLFPPADAEGSSHPLEVIMDAVNPEQFASRASRNQVALALAEQIGMETARLFYTYTDSRLGKNLGGR